MRMKRKQESKKEKDWAQFVCGGCSGTLMKIWDEPYLVDSEGDRYRLKRVGKQLRFEVQIQGEDGRVKDVIFVQGSSPRKRASYPSQHERQFDRDFTSLRTHREKRSGRVTPEIFSPAVQHWTGLLASGEGWLKIRSSGTLTQSSACGCVKNFKLNLSAQSFCSERS